MTERPVVLVLAGVTAASLVLGLAGCGGDDRGSAPVPGEGPPVSLPGPTDDHGTKAAANDMEVELDDFYFGPTFIRAKAGERVTVQLHNEGRTQHTFTSNALGGVDENLAPGARTKITITAPAGGAAVFYCRFHQAQGMQGAVFIG